MLLYIVYIIYFIQKTDSILCYNGTFTNTEFGVDPLKYKGIFHPNRKTMTRLRCASTIMCPGRFEQSGSDNNIN